MLQIVKVVLSYGDDYLNMNNNSVLNVRTIIATYIIVFTIIRNVRSLING